MVGIFIVLVCPPSEQGAGDYIVPEDGGWGLGLGCKSLRAHTTNIQQARVYTNVIFNILERNEQVQF